MIVSKRAFWAWILAALPLSAAIGGEILVLHTLPAEPRPIAAGKSGAALLELALPGRSVVFELEPNRTLLGHMPADFRKRLEWSQVELFEGRVADVPGSWVRLNRQGRTWQGAWFDGKTVHFLDPAAAAKSIGSVPDGAGHVIYRMDDLVIEGLAHDSLPARSSYQSFIKDIGEYLPQAKATLRELNLTVVTDTEFTTLHGSNRDSIVAGRLNVVDGFYRAQLSVQIRLGTLRHLTDNGPLTMTLASGGSGEPTLISTFRSYMSGGAGNSIPKGGLNHLFSGKDFDGSTAGVAYVGVLCSSSFGYAINQVRSGSASTAVIIAHEMGHNFGANHDGGTSSCASGTWIMSPSVNGGLNQFSQCSLDAMLPRAASASCLTAVTTGSGIYANGFEG
nr:M12 family metallo-peptidase [Lysobacter sp. CAU 1642]